MVLEIPDEVLERLLGAGFDATTLSAVLDVPVARLIELAPSDRRRQIAEDAALNEAMRMLAWRTIEEAMMVLDEGSPDQKMKLISKFGGDMARVLTTGDKDQNSEMRQSLSELLSTHRGQT